MKIKDFDGNETVIPVHACLVGIGIASVELDQKDIRLLSQATDEQRIMWIERLAGRLPRGPEE